MIKLFEIPQLKILRPVITFLSGSVGLFCFTQRNLKHRAYLIFILSLFCLAPAMAFAYTYQDVQNFLNNNPAPSGCVNWVEEVTNLNNETGYHVWNRCASSVLGTTRAGRKYSVSAVSNTTVTVYKCDNTGNLQPASTGTTVYGGTFNMAFNFLSTFSYPLGSGEETITIVWKHAYSKIDLDREMELKQIVGARYGEYFARKAKIEIKEGISDEALMELIQSIGVDKFREHFDVERWIAPLQRYTTEYYNLFSAEERAKLEEILRQYKPSLKTK